MNSRPLDETSVERVLIGSGESGMRRDGSRVESVVSAAAVACLAVFVVFALSSTLEAVEERQSAASAMNLLMASTAVANADQVDALGGEFPADRLG